MRTLILLAGLIAAPALAATAFFSGDRVSGFNRICYYDYMGSEYAVTISADRLCPMSIEVEE